MKSLKREGFLLKSTFLTTQQTKYGLVSEIFDVAFTKTLTSSVNLRTYKKIL